MSQHINYLQKKRSHFERDGQLELMLGEVANAVKDAELSVNYSTEKNKEVGAGWKIISHTALADAWHQMGRVGEATMQFQKAEDIQAKFQLDYPQLYSMQGFKYCDLLLTGVERSAWQALLHSCERRAMVDGGKFLDSTLTLPLGDSKEKILTTCFEVEQRGKKMIGWRMPGDSLLTIALDQLTLARAQLYAVCLNPAAGLPPAIRSASPAAVDSLRRAGQLQELPRGLLALALRHRLENRLAGPDSAQAALDEAWEIAERGPMPLFQADIHLHRSRLFFPLYPAAYPWQSPAEDLREARRLIERHGYYRRLPELQDAETALLR